MFACVISQKIKDKTAEKITGQYFPVKSKVTCKNLAHLEAKKKKRPKKSLTLVMQAPLQLQMALVSLSVLEWYLLEVKKA